jgi:hypothetical protein
MGFAFKGWPETSDIVISTLELIKHLATAGVNIQGADRIEMALRISQT